MRNPVVRHRVIARQHEQVARLVSELPERAFELADVRRLLQLHRRCRARRRHLEHGRIDALLRTLPAKVIGTGAARNPEQPRLEPMGGVEGVPILENADKHLLHQVFGQRRTAGCAVQELEHRGVMALEQLAKGVQVSGLHRLHQRFVSHGSVMITSVRGQGYRSTRTDGLTPSRRHDAIDRR